jgi:FkbM family methyltransferase
MVNTWWQDFSCLEDWLRLMVEKHAEDMRGKLLIDVGAYHGEFSSKILLCNVLKRGLLFEPNPNNISYLERHFSGDERFTIEKVALGDQIGAVTFYCNDNLATGSVLRYCPRNRETEGEADKFAVEQTTLDDYLGRMNDQYRVGLIKIDTQGYDLNVLRGARLTIEKSRPWLIVELIFVALYENQANPVAIYDWLCERGYRLAAIFNEHYSEDKWLAFADAVFVPDEIAVNGGGPYHMKPDWTSLKIEVDMLRAVCAERLELINSLHEEAGKRLEIIKQLEKQIKRRRW